MSTSPQPDASWFPDPHDPSQLRWWDGAGWTAHVQPVVVPVVEPSGWDVWPGKDLTGALPATKSADEMLGAWFGDRGFERVGPRPKPDPATLELALTPLRAAGVTMRPDSFRGGYGTPWHAAGVGWVGEVEFEWRESRREREVNLTFVSVPLSAQVLSKFHGMNIEFGLRGRSHESIIERLSSRGDPQMWFSSDSIDTAGDLKSRAHLQVLQNQDRAAINSVLDEPFLVHLNTWASTTPDGGGFLVAGGCLMGWIVGEELSTLGLARVLRAKGKKGWGREHAEPRLEHMVLVTRDLHRRFETVAG